MPNAGFCCSRSIGGARDGWIGREVLHDLRVFWGDRLEGDEGACVPGGADGGVTFALSGSAIRAAIGLPAGASSQEASQ